MVNRIPAIARRARVLRRLSDEVQHRLGDDALFLKYEDLRLHQQTEREELFFNAGYERGDLQWRTTARDVWIDTDTEAKSFAKKLQSLISSTDVPISTVAAIMLTYVRGLVARRT